MLIILPTILAFWHVLEWHYQHVVSWINVSCMSYNYITCPSCWWTFYGSFADLRSSFENVLVPTAICSRYMARQLPLKNCNRFAILICTYTYILFLNTYVLTVQIICTIIIIPKSFKLLDVPHRPIVASVGSGWLPPRMVAGHFYWAKKSTLRIS